MESLKDISSARKISYYGHIAVRGLLHKLPCAELLITVAWQIFHMCMMHHAFYSATSCLRSSLLLQLELGLPFPFSCFDGIIYYLKKAIDSRLGLLKGIACSLTGYRALGWSMQMKRVEVWEIGVIASLRLGFVNNLKCQFLIPSIRIGFWGGVVSSVQSWKWEFWTDDFLLCSNLNVTSKENTFNNIFGWGYYRFIFSYSLSQTWA